MLERNKVGLEDGILNGIQSLQEQQSVISPDETKSKDEQKSNTNSKVWVFFIGISKLFGDPCE